MNPPIQTANTYSVKDVDPLFEDLYTELRSIANAFLGRAQGAQTLTPTVLVHEAYLRLASKEGGKWNNRAHFFRVAGKVLRNSLVEYARKKNAAKRGGDWLRVTLKGIEADESAQVDYMDLDAALTQLESLDARKARVVELKYLCGLENQEVATILDVSLTTVEADWRFAKAWLKQRLES